MEPLICAIGAELEREPGRGLRDAGLMAEIPLLLQHKVPLFRDQDIARRAEHVAFCAPPFGGLEDHPVAGSDP